MLIKYQIEVFKIKNSEIDKKLEADNQKEKEKEKETQNQS